MDLADGIRKIGFARWYERQLIAGHLYFVTGFLSMVLVVACIEEFSLRAPGWKPFALLALIAAGCALCFGSIARYKRMLDGAEHAAERSTCDKCGTYGALEVVQAGETHAAPDGAAVPWVRVRCRKCSNLWTIE